MLGIRRTQTEIVISH